jgi:YqaJ-like viral recombinase domain
VSDDDEKISQIDQELENHKCCQNWGDNQSSGSMESSILAEGFAKSIAMHGLCYRYLIADGDSSTMSEICKTKPYGAVPVFKFECVNHLWRAFNGHLKDIVGQSSKLYPIALRKLVGTRYTRLRRKVKKYASYRLEQDGTIDEKSVALKGDIKRALHCIFGDHADCITDDDQTFCTAKDKEDSTNYARDLKSTGLWAKILGKLLRLIKNTRSLLENKTSNLVECVNAVLAKFAVNKSRLLARTYSTRLNLGIMSFNNEGLVQKALSQSLYNSSPGSHTKKMEAKKQKKNRPIIKKMKSFGKSKSHQQKDFSYGHSPKTPPLEGAELISTCMAYLETIRLTDAEIREIERKTKNQAECELWGLLRKYMLTASKHGLICKWLQNTSCRNKVFDIIYSTPLTNVKSLDHGKMNESVARALIEKILGIIVERAGLFVCEEHPFLAASPDGLIGDDTLIEIKCPYGARDMTPEEGILEGKIDYWKVTSADPPTFAFNKNHVYYYQIQSQLHYANREQCLFVAYTEKAPYIKYEYIPRDRDFYKNTMEPKLVKFYMDCMLPEIVDPMFGRPGAQIRDPQYIIDKLAKKSAAKKAAEESGVSGVGVLQKKRAKRQHENNENNVTLPRKKKRALNDITNV